MCKTLYNMFSEEPSEQELYHSIATVASLLLRIGEVGKKFNNGGSKAPPTAPPTATPEGPGDADSLDEAQVCQVLAEAQLEETRDDTSVSSFSVVSSSSTEDAVLTGGSEQRQGSVLDADWSITFEQVLASLLTEPPLVDFFEKKRDVQVKMATCRGQQVERQTSSTSDHDSVHNSV